MIRAIFFDFGGVILSSPFGAFNRYEDDVGLPRDTIRQLNTTAPDTNAWARLERGELTVDEFGAAFEVEAAGAGFEVDANRVLAALKSEPRPEMVEAVRRCSHRFRTALLTNNFRSIDGAGRDPEIDAVMELFDVVVESSVVGVRKPEPDFYRIACDLVGVSPEECVFLDDLGINLKPARAMGMATIKVDDPSTALDELGVIVGFSLG